MSTTTHTHVTTEFANPYLCCDVCHQFIEGIVAFDGQVPGCRHQGHNVPCGHRMGYTNLCPSWGPVNGCECLAHLGYVPHEQRVTSDPTASDTETAPENVTIRPDYK